MNISDILNNPANAQTKTATQTTAGLSPLEKVRQHANSKIQTEVDATKAQLSSFGQLKSAVSNTQLAAQTLGSLPSTASSAEVKTAVQNFVSAFNSAINTAKTTAATPGAATHNASQTGRDLSRSVMADLRTFDALKKLGVSMGSDGSLNLDSKKLDTAQKTDPVGAQATLTKIGRQVEKTALKELATDGHVSGSMNSLNARASLLKTQQGSLASLAEATTASPSSATANTGTTAWSRGFGASAYQNSANLARNSWNA
jgi:hypothetical protein